MDSEHPPIGQNHSQDAAPRPVRTQAVTRRHFLLTTGCGAAALLLAGGCGGGGKGFVNPPATTPEPIVLVPANRTEPTGDLANQINQFSESVDALSLSYSEPSQAITDLENFANANAASRQVVATASFETMIAAAQIALPALHDAYERTINVTLHLDQVGYLGDTVSQNNSLTGTASVSNPQWIAAMMERNYHLLNIMGNLMRFYQTSGLTPLADLVRMQTDPIQRLAAYAVAANVFNDWIDSVTAQVGIAARPEWKLDVSQSITADSALTQVERIQGIALSLPLGPGYRGTPSKGRSLDAQGFVDAAREFAATGLGAFTEKLLVKQFGSNKYRIEPDRVRALFKNGASSFLGSIGSGVAEEALINVTTSALQVAYPGSTGETAACLVKIAIETSDLIKSVLALIASAETIVGALFFGAITVSNAISLRKTIDECIDPIAKTIAGDMGDSPQRFDVTNGVVTTPRDTPAFTNPTRAECD